MKALRALDRSFTEEGFRDVTVNDAGQVETRLDGFFDQSVVFGPGCTFAGYTPGQSSHGVPNFSCEGEGSPVDFSEQPWDNPFFALEHEIFAPTTKWSGFASIEYDLEMLGDMTAFGQIMISNRRSIVTGRDGQFFPLVPAENIYNPFGTDVVAVAFDRDSRSDTDDTESTYQRFLGGLKGNVDVLNDAGGSFNNWTWEFSLGYTRSEGANQFDIVRQDRFVNSINNCTNPAQSTFSGSSPECVIINLFGPDFMLRGDFGDARDYIVTRVLNNTLVEQTAYELGATGDVFDLPAGPVGVFLGVSRRVDSIHSNVDRHLEEGNAWGVSSEGDTIGKTTLKEVYGEVDVPILSGKTLAEDVGINASYRVTNDKFFGTNDTWRVTGHWDFTDYLRLRGTVGTSFRAPNLKELFLADQTGFSNAFNDPCINSDPDNDERSQTIIDNCLSEGVDPFTLGIDGAPSIETVSGGADDLLPETSDSWSVGAVFTQPWFDNFDFQFSIDYTSIKIKDAVAQPTAGFILNQCYTSPGFSDPLCSRVTRQIDQPLDLRFLDQVDESVANIEVENFKDISFSTLFNKDFGSVNFIWNADFTRMKGLKSGLFIETADELVGSIDVPKWQIQSSETLTFGDWGVSHRVYYRSSGADTEAQIQDQGTGPDDVTWISSFHTHSFSVSYNQDSWRAFLTLENAFNAEPDIIDDLAFFENSINNMPVGVYPAEAIMGRTLILSVRKNL